MTRSDPPLACFDGALEGLLVAAFSLLVLTLPGLRAQESAPDREVRAQARLRARALALDTAHALAVAEDGTRRALPWEGWVGPGGEEVVPLQLFRGNAYHLVLGASGGEGESEGLLAELFDGLGRPVPVERAAGRGRMILSLAPSASGTYFLRVRAPSGKAGCAVSLTYVFH